MRSKRERKGITINNICLLVKHKPRPFLSFTSSSHSELPSIFIFHHSTHPLTSISIASHDPDLHFLTPGASSNSGHPFMNLLLHPMEPEWDERWGLERLKNENCEGIGLKGIFGIKGFVEVQEERARKGYSCFTP